jgi:hypothetical protein
VIGAPVRRVEDYRKSSEGRIVHKTIGTVLQNRGDAYVQDCKMK